MARYEIVGPRARFDVTLRPGLPDLRVRVHDASGWMEMALFADGSVDLDQPVTGQVALKVSGLHTHNRLLATGIHHLLGDATETSAAILVLGAQPHAPGTTSVELRVTVAGRDATVRTPVRLEVHRDEEIEAVGHVRCDPRALGVPLPPMVNPMVNVRWHLRLRPVLR